MLFPWISKIYQSLVTRFNFSKHNKASQVALVVKNTHASARDMSQEFDPWVGKVPWRRVWQPTPVFLAGESHGQRSLMGCSPWGHKESDTTEAT